MSNRGALALIGVSAPLAWAGLTYLVMNTTPDALISRAMFFALLYIAVLSTFGLAAYFLSLKLTISKQYRGNVARAIQQGAIIATFGLVAALLQAARALSAMAGIVLLMALLIVQYLFLRTKQRPR